jgi:ribosomal subunit interface protein
MNIHITAKNLELTAGLEAHINEKMASLGKFLERYEELGELELKATIERAVGHHHKGEVFRAAADLVLPKENLHAEEAHEDAYAAIDAVKNKLHHEIENYRGKHDSI